MKIPLKKLENINPWVIIGMLFLVYVVLILKSPNILSGDEIFYYDQARNMRNFQLVYFENTQPFAFPAFLALLWTENVYVLRIANAALFCLALLYLFKLTEKIASRTAAFIAVLILGFSKFAIQYITTLHTESLFGLAIFASFWYFLKSYEDKKWRNYLLFAIWLAIALETRVTGLALFAAFPLYLISFDRKNFTIKFFISLLIAGLLFLPYILHTSGKFLLEKAFLTRGGMGESLFALTQTLSHFTLPFILLLAFAFCFYRVKDKMQLILLTAIIYSIGLLLPETILFTRQFLPLFMILVPLVADAIVKQQNKVIYGTGMFLLIFFLISNVRIIPDLPKFYHQAYYLETPEGCTELKKFSVDGETKTLPYFSQPPGWKEYVAEFSIDRNYNYLILEYLDDELVDTYLDGNSIKNTFYFAPYSRQVANTNFTAGKHTLKIIIGNRFNIGGIGQVLLCEHHELHKGEIFVFPPEEII